MSPGLYFFVEKRTFLLQDLDYMLIMLWRRRHGEESRDQGDREEGLGKQGKESRDQGAGRRAWGGRGRDPGTKRLTIPV